MPGIKLIRATGGNKYVHVPTCPIIQDWDMEGTVIIDRFNPKKMFPCPACSRMVYISSAAKDIAKNYKGYEALINKYNITKATLEKLILGAKCKLELCGTKLYVRKKNDLFYIDFSVDVVLFHNNYIMKNRENGVSNDSRKGYHEHTLMNEDACDKFNEALRQIANYDFSEAQKTHKKKKGQRMKLSEYDAEYWGFSSEY